MPPALVKTYGDAEGAEWWEKNAELLEEARLEWGKRDDEMYLFANTMVQVPRPGLFGGSVSSSVPSVASAKCLQPEVKAALINGSAAALHSVLHEVCRDSAGHAVYAIDLFTDEFCDRILAELDHIEASGIPLRRPNGMNRFGAILSQLGFQEGLLEPLMTCVVEPFAQLLWPEWVDKGDCGESYGFVVRYRIGEDVDLAEHADTSNVTLNACLGRDFIGGDLYFKGVRFTESDNEKEERPVGHKKGRAVLHLGGHFHGVRPITGGERANLVLWATGKGGYVRIRPTSP